MPPGSLSSLPIPPPELLQRIGPMGETNPVRVFEESGATHRKFIEEMLPDDWSWEGKRTLDFGCGSGRVIRNFLPETDESDFWGCDIDRPSIDWLKSNLEPPFHFFTTDEAASLPQEDGFFNLIYAFSVYTHLTENWAGWMLEHHRTLADGGYLLVSYLGEGMSEALTAEAWDEDRTGHNPQLHGYPWELGGPIAFNSQWWIHAHWGRAFEIVKLLPFVASDPPAGHGMALLRKKSVPITEEELLRLEPDEPREIAAIQHNVEQLRDDTLRLRTENAQLRDHLASAEAAAKENERLRHELEASSSWRLTAPLRAAKARRR